VLCSKCGVENPAGKKVYGDCAAPLANICPKCSFENPPGKRFCGDCGASLEETAAGTSPNQANEPQVRASASVSEALEGERKTVTALLADINGSTELEQDLDPEEARAIVDPALKLMIDAAHRYDGYVVDRTAAASSRENRSGDRVAICKQPGGSLRRARISLRSKQ
jgi:Double zinc ribbon